MTIKLRISLEFWQHFFCSEYSGLRLSLNKQSPVYIVNWHFSNIMTDDKSACSHNLVFTTIQSFPISYCMTLCLKGLQKYNLSKLKLLNSLNVSRTFNFDLSYFWYPFRYRVIQYLIGKLSDMVKMGQDSLVVAALLASVRTSWKVTIYYINGALLILNRYALYYLLVLGLGRRPLLGAGGVAKSLEQLLLFGGRFGCWKLLWGDRDSDWTLLAAGDPWVPPGPR